nr:hypothetical protein Iba_scaffold15400CG0230 [Ipomoea batatas]
MPWQAGSLPSLPPWTSNPWFQTTFFTAAHRYSHNLFTKKLPATVRRRWREIEIA